MAAVLLQKFAASIESFAAGAGSAVGAAEISPVYAAGSESDVHGFAALLHRPIAVDPGNAANCAGVATLFD
jgi:hypothetical protein